MNTYQLTHHSWQPVAAATDHSKTRKWRALFQPQPSSPPSDSQNILGQESSPQGPVQYLTTLTTKESDVHCISRERKII